MMLSAPALTSWIGLSSSASILAGRQLDELLGELEDLPQSLGRRSPIVRRRLAPSTR
jgi:hypothetical protein